ncbi:MAG TPA: hypothetical protein VHV55_22350 [Pirellulales bacterium]|jgi:hypothetical protein|nr:hypothetical protein [Pirellulales bacterium]
MAVSGPVAAPASCGTATVALARGAVTAMLKSIPIKITDMSVSFAELVGTGLLFEVNSEVIGGARD